MFGKRKKIRKSNRVTISTPGLKLAGLFRKSTNQNDQFFEDFEDLLLEADFGPSYAVELGNELRTAMSRKKSWNSDILTGELRSLLQGSLRTCDLVPDRNMLTVYLVLGVNGVGKTTTIARMANKFKSLTDSMVFAAADTFRAAAVEQLAVFAERTGARLVSQQQGADPGAVVHDAISSAISRGDRLVLADTAGRLHNRENLVAELEKIDRIVKERISSVESVYRKILVIDATTGQNGIRQAETFNESVGIDAIIMTKYDSTAKGGMVAAISHRLGIPVAYLGCGEGLDDLIKFDKDRYLDDLLGNGQSGTHV